MCRNIDIIFFGDSLTFGYGVKKESSWAYKVAHEISCTSLNKAHNGDTTPSMLSRYYTDVLKYSPLNIFIMCGTNDLLLGRSIKSIINNIEIMIKDAININSKPIIGIPPAVIGKMANELFSSSSLYDYAEKELITLRNQLICLCKKYSIEFINFYDLILNNKNLYLEGLHLTSIGHELMYQEALPYFKDIVHN